VLRAHGLSKQSVMDVFRATVESKIQYAAPAWSGICTAGDPDRLNAFLRRCVKLGYRDKSTPYIEDIFGDCDEQLFSRINTNSLHILQQYLPERSSLSYSLRLRRHNKTLIASVVTVAGICNSAGGGVFVNKPLRCQWQWLVSKVGLLIYRAVNR